MKVLLDTHLLVWTVGSPERLSEDCRKLLLGATVFVSSVVLWELAIKSATGKLVVDFHELGQVLYERGYKELPVTWAHARAVDQLPGYHRDPFDRMLVAQAITEPLRLLTSDRTLARYSDLVHVV